ncbi:MAG: hypothetical protein FJ293_03420 [Planctomycetes bacterium]|nr:hypothetical protein [Planctomycetota bacterium]
MRRAARLALVLLGATASILAAPRPIPDTLILKGGKRLEDVVVSRQDDAFVVVNPWNSRWPEMTFEIPEKNRIARDKVEQVIVAERPLVEYRQAAAKRGLTAADHLALARRCVELGLKDEALVEARRCLALAPDDAAALPLAGGRTAFETFAKGNPDVDPALAELERRYLAATDSGERAALLKEMKAGGSTRPVAWLERAHRSAAQPKGRREKIRLTLHSEQAPGATYCLLVPKSYDPRVPTGLVIALHGGGRGGVDPTLVTGSGEEAMPFYVDVAEKYGVIVACPTALAAPWSHPKNEPLIDALLEELQLLWNIDENRIWLTGHSMGGGGTWHWGPKRAEVWAAFAPCAGWGGPATGGLPVYIYHGSDDAIVGPDSDRASARILAGDKKRPDFVYTEVDQVGHGFPDWVVDDLFKFFTGRWKDRGKKRATAPQSSFLRKASKEEVRCFGDPATPPAADAAVDGADATLAALIARLEKGGGSGEEAVAELARRRDATTVKAVGRVLAARKGARAASSDARVLAARTLGELALAECIKPLAAAADDDDFRVVDAVATALGRCPGAEAREPLQRVARRMGAFFEESRRGDSLVFTEYKIRCESFGRLCDAFAAQRDAATALPALRDELVARLLAPKSPYRIPTDERFDEIPGAARLALVRKLRACLVALASRDGAALLEATAAAWPDEAALVKECREGAAQL